MTKELTLDFGLLIAYAIPGGLALKGIAYFQAPVNTLFRHAYTGEHTLGALSALVLLAVMSGMILSVVRASTLDHSFEVPFWIPRWFRRAIDRLLGWRFIGTYLRAVTDNGFEGNTLYGHRRCDPQYAVISDLNRLEALRDAIVHDKRRYQFYGNTLLAVLICLCCLAATAYREGIEPERLFRVALFVAIIGPLYSAARASHNRYMCTVDALNTPPPAPETNQREEDHGDDFDDE
jgi:hypothetical protein